MLADDQSWQKGAFDPPEPLINLKTQKMLGGQTDGILSVANLIYKPNLRLQKIRPNIQNIVLTLSGNLSWRLKEKTTMLFEG